jgi:hypothetical protein
MNKRLKFTVIILLALLLMPVFSSCQQEENPCEQVIQDDFELVE